VDLSEGLLVVEKVDLFAGFIPESNFGISSVSLEDDGEALSDTVPVVTKGVDIRRESITAIVSLSLSVHETLQRTVVNRWNSNQRQMVRKRMEETVVVLLMMSLAEARKSQPIKTPQDRQ